MRWRRIGRLWLCFEHTGTARPHPSALRRILGRLRLCLGADRPLSASNIGQQGHAGRSLGCLFPLRAAGTSADAHAESRLVRCDASGRPHLVVLEVTAFDTARYRPRINLPLFSTSARALLPLLVPPTCTIFSHPTPPLARTRAPLLATRCLHMRTGLRRGGSWRPRRSTDGCGCHARRRAAPTARAWLTSPGLQLICSPVR